MAHQIDNFCPQLYCAQSGQNPLATLSATELAIQHSILGIYLEIGSKWIERSEMNLMLESMDATVRS